MTVNTLARPTRQRPAESPYLAALYKAAESRDVTRWAERHFYIPETEAPIELLPHQKAILRYALRRDEQGRFAYQTIIWSTPKKSGKTTIGGVVARWAAETWGPFQLIFCVGNDAKQAKERVYASAIQSIELTPGFQRNKRELPDKWRFLETEATCLTTGSQIKAIATDYQGEAGANPSLTIWTELWGFIHKADLRFWAEMAPSPTRLNSLRWVETYAGFEGESELLWGLYEAAVLGGRQLQAKDVCLLSAFAEATAPDSPLPCYVNDPAGIFAYWDAGEQAHRMPWQQGEHGRQYYASEASTQTPLQFERLHLNQWVSAESSFVPMELWDRCQNPLPLRLEEKTPLVVALDAGVTGDCFGLVVVSRDPDDPVNNVAVRAARKWSPEGKPLDYAVVEAALRELCDYWNVVEVAFDIYQLHDFATRLQKDGVAWFREFGQDKERRESDKLLYDLITHRRVRHDGNADLREHIANCNVKMSKDEDTKLKLVKKSENRHIDLAVCLSMAAAECLRLNL